MSAARSFRKVGVLGLGLMGTGIAQVTASAVRCQKATSRP
jgi:3-hydroxyacyl-CoA dehydrogenase